MNNIKFILIIVLFISYNYKISAQYDFYSIIDTSQLKISEFTNMKNVNTANLEFSPSLFGNGFVYVYSPALGKSKKYDKKIDESFFELKYFNFNESEIENESNNFLSDVSITNHAGPCSFTDDNQLMFLSRNRKDAIKRENEEKDINPMGIYIYKNVNGFWQLSGALPVNNYGYKVFHPTWDGQNKRLIFASDMPGGFGGTDLYSMKLEDSIWIDLKNLGHLINSENNEAFPFIYNSKYLFYASNKTGGKGGLDNYISIEYDGQFLKSINLGDKFNTEYDDFGLIIGNSPEYGYFTSNRPGGEGKDDIYKFSSEKSVFAVFNNHFTITCKDKLSGKPIKNAEILFSKFDIIKNENPKIGKLRGVDKELIYTIDSSTIKRSKAIYTDEKGQYNMMIPEGSYIIDAKKNGYQDYSKVFFNNNPDKHIKIELLPELIDTFFFSFLDAEDNRAIVNMSFDIQDGVAKEIGQLSDSKYYLVLGRNDKLNLLTTGDNYNQKKITFNFNSTPKNFDIVLDKKVKYVEKLPEKAGETFILKDLYYDYNSYSLNSKAKKELDKLITHMVKFPQIKIELSSHTDSRGNKDYNLKLSEQRSESAKNYLVSKGIASERIIAKGYGETKLRNNCTDSIICTEAEHAINRRTEVKVLK